MEVGDEGDAMTDDRTATIVRGGWEGHAPVATTDAFVPFLREHGFAVRIEESTAVYADPEAMAATDLVLQCVTMSQIGDDEVRGLRTAVAAGTGFAGWHGGIVDSFRATSDYQQLTGALFASHPAAEGGGWPTHTIELTDLGREHPVTAGLDDFELTTEQYWLLADDLSDVLATTTQAVLPGSEWTRPVVSPAVWVRRWGAGRVFVSAPGHDPEVLAHPSVRTIVERGLLWAAR
jgi:uncharacterized protein